jgi:hypothetical protein
LRYHFGGISNDELDAGRLVKAGKNTGDNPEGKGLSGLEVFAGCLGVRRAAEVGYWATSAARQCVRTIVRIRRRSADA